MDTVDYNRLNSKQSTAKYSTGSSINPPDRSKGKYSFRHEGHGKSLHFNDDELEDRKIADKAVTAPTTPSKEISTSFYACNQDDTPTKSCTNSQFKKRLSGIDFARIRMRNYDTGIDFLWIFFPLMSRH